jgi:hypothetical protein
MTEGECRKIFWRGKHNILRALDGLIQGPTLCDLCIVLFFSTTFEMFGIIQFYTMHPCMLGLQNFAFREVIKYDHKIYDVYHKFWNNIKTFLNIKFKTSSQNCFLKK